MKHTAGGCGKTRPSPLAKHVAEAEKGYKRPWGFHLLEEFRYEKKTYLMLLEIGPEEVTVKFLLERQAGSSNLEERQRQKILKAYLRANKEYIISIK